MKCSHLSSGLHAREERIQHCIYFFLYILTYFPYISTFLCKSHRRHQDHSGSFQRRHEPGRELDAAVPRLTRPHHGSDLHLGPQRGPAGPGGPRRAVPPRGGGERDGRSTLIQRRRVCQGGACDPNNTQSDHLQNLSEQEVLLVSQSLKNEREKAPQKKVCPSGCYKEEQ